MSKKDRNICKNLKRLNQWLSKIASIENIEIKGLINYFVVNEKANMTGSILG